MSDKVVVKNINCGNCLCGESLYVVVLTVVVTVMVAVLVEVVVAVTAVKVGESDSSGGSDCSGGSAKINSPITKNRNARSC